MAKRFDSPIVDDTEGGPGDYPNSEGPGPFTEQQNAEVVRLLEGEPDAGDLKIPMEEQVQQAMTDFDAKQVKQLNGQGAEPTPDSSARDYQLQRSNPQGVKAATSATDKIIPYTFFGDFPSLAAQERSWWLVY